MIDPGQVLLLGFDRQDLIANAGIAGGIIFGLTVLAMIAVAVLPAYSDRWAEWLGTTNTTPAGPDPAETIPGREEPIPPEESGRGTDPALGGEDDEATAASSATPEPEVAGEDA